MIGSGKFGLHLFMCKNSFSDVLAAVATQLLSAPHHSSKRFS